jgi:hypothetical protein
MAREDSRWPPARNHHRPRSPRAGSKAHLDVLCTKGWQGSIFAVRRERPSSVAMARENSRLGLLPEDALLSAITSSAVWKLLFQHSGGQAWAVWLGTGAPPDRRQGQSGLFLDHFAFQRVSS